MKKGVLLLLAVFCLSLPVWGQNARIQVIHNAADIDARTVDFWAGDSLWVDDLSFRSATEFRDIAAGNVSFQVSPANQTPQDSLVAQLDMTLEAGKAYVLILNGITQMNLNKYVNPDPNRNITISVFALADAKEASDDTAKVALNLFHGSTDAPVIDVIVEGLGFALVDNLDYGNATGYQAVDPGSVNLLVTPGDDNATVIGKFEADLSGFAGKAMVAFVSGFVDPAKNEGGQKLGLFGALPDGQVVEFPSLLKGPIGDWTFAGLSDYQFDGIFAEDTVVAGGHGIVVDKYNRIWIGNYSVPALYVKNPDGTDAPFSPIDTIVVDTLRLPAKRCRGMGVAKDGNILAVFMHKYLVKIDVETGQGLAVWEGPGSLTKPAVDGEGYIYVGKVVGVSPVNVIDPGTFELTQQIDLPGAPGFTRGIEVSKDGKDIWSGDLGEAGGPVKQWHSEDLLTYTLTDSIFTNTEGELIFETQRVTMDWDPMGRLWVSVDNSYDVSDNSKNALVILDFEKKEYQKLPMPDLGEGVGNGPRGVAFSVTGDTAYAISWNGGVVFRFVRKAVGIDDESVVGLPTQYRLEQNYPNPFNPSTVIPFELPKKGHVTLKVYDNLGREVKVLVDRVLPAGRHKVTFNAKGLATGVYFYRLSVDGTVISRKMLLAK